MKILFLLSRFPYPLEKGDKLRAFNQIRILSKKHEIYLFALCEKYPTENEYKKLKAYCKKIYIVKISKLNIAISLFFALFSQIPFQVAYFTHHKAHKKLKKIIAEISPDHIYCQLIRTAEYVKNIKGINKSIDYMDAFSRNMEGRIVKSKFYERLFLKREKKRVKRYEHFIFNFFQNKIIISEQDKKLIIHPNNYDIIVVPNGVEQKQFYPINLEKKYDILFTGNMSYPPNILGAEYIIKKILPLLIKDFPDIKIAIVGANPPKELYKLAKQNKNIFISGWVKDISQYYALSKIFVAPMEIGTGMQNKLLEAMAMKIPCVTSALANNAIGAINGKSILIANSPDEYCFHITQLLHNNALSNKIAENAYNFVKDNYSWNKACEKLMEIFDK